MHLNKYIRMTEDNKQNEHKEETKKPQDHSGVMMTGHIKIFDPDTGEVIVDKSNAILKVYQTVCQIKQQVSYTKWRLVMVEHLSIQQEL